MVITATTVITIIKKIIDISIVWLMVYLRVSLLSYF